MSSKRISYLDILKGFGIFFVVFGHVTHNSILREYIWNFHMPLFFLVSGLFHNSSNTFKSFFLKRIKSIYIPYVLFFTITFSYWVVIERYTRGGEYSVLHQLTGLFYGTYEGYHLYFNGALWFLPCLFVTELLFYPIGKIQNKIGIIGFLLLSFVIGTLLKMNEIDYLPFGLHTAFFAVIFYGVGYLSKQLPDYISKTQNNFLWLIIVCCLCIQILSIGQYASSISKCNLPYIPLALVGVLLYLTLAIRIRHNKLIEYLGRNSLVIFALQEPTYRAIIFLFSKTLGIEVEPIRQNLLLSIAITGISIGIITPAIYLYDQYVRVKINSLF